MLDIDSFGVIAADALSIILVLLLIEGALT